MGTSKALSTAIMDTTKKTRKPLLQQNPMSFSSLDEKIYSTLSSSMNKVINIRLVPLTVKGIIMRNNVVYTTGIVTKLSFVMLTMAEEQSR